MVSTRTKVVRIVFPLTAVALMPAVAGAAGFEKALIWSAKNAGMGGAVTGFVSGAEATVWNPAGLAGSGNEVSGSFGPAFSQFKNPVVSATPVEAKAGFSPLFGVTGSYKVNEKLGVGVGVHTIGGSSVKYENVTIPSFAATFSPETQLSLIEITGGAGYEVLEGLKVGAAYRFTLANATLAGAPITGATAIALGAGGAGTRAIMPSFNDLTGNNAGGFRVGLQYAPKGGSWGVGATYRNEISASTTGTFSGTVKELTNGSTLSTITGTSALTAKLPQAVNLGGYYDFSKDLRVSLEYGFTNYAVVSVLEGSFAVAAAPTTNNAANTTLKFNDQNQIRLGGEYRLNEKTVVRGGYVFTSQVTGTANASATMIPPGAGHSFVAGAGLKVSDSIGVDVAGEYAQTKGTATAPFAAEYSATAFTAYAGVTYGF
jgi:long-subunit fatty acid transport protein